MSDVGIVYEEGGLCGMRGRKRRRKGGRRREEGERKDEKGDESRE